MHDGNFFGASLSETIDVFSNAIDCSMNHLLCDKEAYNALLAGNKVAYYTWTDDYIYKLPNGQIVDSAGNEFLFIRSWEYEDVEDEMVWMIVGNKT